ncbi:MAG: GGDEF domain-containing protein [Clostridia bacterium]|nr:GGDEF domain-containing protein [Clostridia bacterium]
MSETSTNFVLMPKTETGEINVYPLAAYSNELKIPRRGNQVMERFQGYDVSEEALSLLSTAADSATKMMDAKLHALALVNTVHPLPDIDYLNSIPLPALTEEEQAMTDDDKMAAAKLYVLGSVYSLNKQSVSQNVNECVEVIRASSSVKAAETARRVHIQRTVLWITTVAIMVILIGTFIVLYTQIIYPLADFVKLISANQTLDERKGLREVRLLAVAYNSLVKRRDALDGILRSAAETDALSNLPNRYRFEQFMLESGESGYSIGVLLFDINFLKQTNDTKGHLVGDKLIRTAAECISSCFGADCFRFGGDDFAAVVKNCDPETIQQMIRKFEETEKQKNVSISMGFAYADEIGKTTVKKLLDEADKKSTPRKKEVHQSHGGVE